MRGFCEVREKFLHACEIFSPAEKSLRRHATTRVELTGFKGNRDDKVQQLSKYITRFRSLMRAIYGPDSKEYGQAGGTRVRDRKTPKPRVTAAPA